MKKINNHVERNYSNMYIHDTKEDSHGKANIFMKISLVFKQDNQYEYSLLKTWSSVGVTNIQSVIVNVGKMEEDYAIIFAIKLPFTKKNTMMNKFSTDGRLIK